MYVKWLEANLNQPEKIQSKKKPHDPLFQYDQLQNWNPDTGAKKVVFQSKWNKNKTLEPDWLHCDMQWSLWPKIHSTKKMLL